MKRTWLIGDVHGCAKELDMLLRRIKFDEHKDQLLFAGDLINRGPNSLEVVRLVRSLEKKHNTVLGNHDLSYLAQVVEGRRLNSQFRALHDASDGEDIFHWLRRRPLAIQKKISTPNGYKRLILTHAGSPHIWTPKQTLKHAKLLSAELSSKGYRSFLKRLHHSKSVVSWNKGGSKYQHLVTIADYLTRMRLITQSGDLVLSRSITRSGRNRKGGLQPWFRWHKRNEYKNSYYAFGHWAMLRGRTEMRNFIALDTACVWGGVLSAWCAEENRRVTHDGSKLRL